MKLKFINSLMYSKPTLVLPSDLVFNWDKETSSSQSKLWLVARVSLQVQGFDP